MSAALRLLDIARCEIGTVESPAGSNRTKYGQAYGTNGVAWCQIFIWWAFQAAGMHALVPKTAYTPTAATWFRTRGQWGTAPRQGALVFFDFPDDGVNRISHVGLVEAVNADGTLTTIEGNTTAPAAAGSQRDGGGVWRRTRKTGVVGYGYPAWPASATNEAATPSPQEVDLQPDERDMLRTVYHQLTGTFDVGPGTRLPGWPGFPGGTGESLTPVDYLRRTNVRIEDLHRRLAAVETGKTNGPATLSDADVTRIAAAVVSLLSERIAK